MTRTEKQIIERAVKSPIVAMRNLVTKSLYFFLQYFWDQYSEDEFQPNWHIKYICDELQIVSKRVALNHDKEYDLIINVPPGSSKTAIISIMFPLWCWIQWHWMRFITASYSSALSLESAEYSRDVLRSEKFAELFPELSIKLDKDTKSNFRVVKQTDEGEVRGGNRLSTSVGGSVAGFHGHINIIDDPIDPMRAISEAELKKANHWMDNTLPFRKVDKRVTPTILIMQRLHQDDPTGHLLKEKATEIKHICLPGEIRNYRQNVSPPELVDMYTDDLMDVNRLDWEVLQELLNLGQFTYGGQVGQDPVPLGGGMFETDHLKTIERMPNDLLIDRIVRYWDKAATDGGGAFTVGAKMARLKDGSFLVMDVKRGQWGTAKREKIIKQTAEADGPDVTIYIEQEPGSGGKDSAVGTIKNLAGFRVYADRPTGDKVFRADPYSVQMNEGNVSMLRAGWNEPYVDELKNFPASTFKDQTDASSGAFGKLVGLRQVKVMQR